MITGSAESMFLLYVVLNKKLYYFYYIDLDPILGKNSASLVSDLKPVTVTYPEDKHEFDYFLSLEGFQHRYYLT
jgi:hypothetical protein